MIYSLPKISGDAVELPHFPTRAQAFIFRACEYLPTEVIAKVLRTDADTVNRAREEMGLPDYNPGELWLTRGYITIIRRMWHILPYEQLTELLGIDEDALARLMRDEDFLDVKLSDKPYCERVVWRELTDKERAETRKIKDVMRTLDLSGKAPFDFEYRIPEMKFEGEEIFSTRMIYAFSGLYQHAFDVDSETFLPDGQLAAYQALGINGIWTQCLLSQVAPNPFDREAADAHLTRLGNMRKMTERLAKYGIKLYLYLNEPRSMPTAFFETRPDLKGHERDGEASLCTSVPEVRKYLTDSVEYVCRAVPKLGGFFSITRSENLTNCYSHSGDADRPCLCPRCKERSVGEVVAEVIGCYLEGVRRVSDEIKVFAWSWRWDDESEAIIRRLPKGVILLSQSELDMPFDIGGVRGNVLDYSMSIVGPGERARREWQLGKECGLELGAKVQVSTTWEASTVPAIPVSPSIDEHINRLKDEGVRHLLLSWTLGGYPSSSIAAAAKHFYEKSGFSTDGAMRKAEEQFVRAFREFPFHIDVLYFGPQNAGPSNLLYPTPTGKRSSMTCFPYDDIERWRGIYPTEVFEGQLDKLCCEWEKGLKMIPEGEKSEAAVMARAVYCLFRSSLNQLRFIKARDDGRRGDAVKAAKDELKTTLKMLSLMNENAAIGYEASNHYYFSKGQLAEKAVNCHYVIDRFSE